MAKRNKFLKYTTITLVLLLSVAFLIKVGGPDILRNYIASGIGSCKTEPVLCMIPAAFIDQPAIDENYKAELTRYTMPIISISGPKGYNVVEEMVKRFNYKKNKRFDKDEYFYMLYEKPGFFPGLYPDIRKAGVNDNYEFLRRVMHGQLNKIQNIPDAFFVIMKGIFTPDLGDQSQASMAVFTLGTMRGFINYNIAGKEHFFDCNVIAPDDSLFKVYIKDPRGKLNLQKVFTILSTIKKNQSAQAKH